jgi:hypothetical protein
MGEGKRRGKGGAEEERSGRTKGGRRRGGKGGRSLAIFLCNVASVCRYFFLLLFRANPRTRQLFASDNVRDGIFRIPRKRTQKMFIQHLDVPFALEQNLSLQKIWIGLKRLIIARNNARSESLMYYPCAIIKSSHSSVTIQFNPIYNIISAQ